MQCADFISVENKSGTYQAIRIYGILLWVFSFVLTILIAVYSMSSISTTISAFSANTFLHTHQKGSSEYTWFSWDTSDALTSFYKCTQNARIFDTVCDMQNITLYSICIAEKYPKFSYCVNTQSSGLSPPQFPLLTMTQALMSCFFTNTDPSGYMPGMTDFAVPLIDMTEFQQDILQRCIAPDQQPILTVLQDRNSKHYLGSYNSGIVLFTVVYIIMLFLFYTIYIPPSWVGSDEDNVEDPMQFPKLNYYRNDKEGKTSKDVTWYRTGFWVTLISFIISAFLIVVLALFTWRTSETEPFKNNVPMTIQTSTICMTFALMTFYYFGMELWEKLYIQNVTVPMDKHQVQKPTKGITARIGMVMTPGIYEKGDKQAPLLIFPWAEFNVFVDALVFIGILGLQTDITTLEITQIFQVATYAAIAGVVFAYDYHIQHEGKDIEAEQITMSFCSNMAVWTLNFIPFVLVIMRFNGVIPDTIQTYLISYVVIHYFAYWIKIIWQLVYTSPIKLGWEELFWCAKVTKQLLFICLIFFAAIQNFKMNDTLRADVNVWLVNY